MKRRRLLQSAGAVTGASILSTRVVAGERSAKEVNHGTRRVIDLNITHENPDSRIPRMNSGGIGVSTLVDNGRLFGLEVPTGRVTAGSEPLIRTPAAESGVVTKQYEQDPLFADAGVNRVGADVLRPDEGYSPIKLNVSASSDRTVVTDQNGEKVASVERNGEARVPLDNREVKIKTFGPPEEREVTRPGHSGTTTVRPVTGTESVSVSPVLLLRDNGNLSVFASDDGPVVPTQRPEVAYMIEGAKAQNQGKIREVSGKDMVVIDQNGGD